MAIGGRTASHFTIIREVRLVIITTIQSQLRRAHFHPRMKQLHRPLKSLHPAPRLRSQPNLLAKNLRNLR